MLIIVYYAIYAYYSLRISEKHWEQGGSGNNSLATDYIQLATLVAQMVKSLPAMQETQGLIPVWEGPLEKGMATHSSIFA